MARKILSRHAARLAAGNALFAGGLALIAIGSWMASTWWVLASCLMGGVILLALAELVTPFPDKSRASRPRFRFGRPR